MMAAGIFPFANLARQISWIHIFQAGLLAEFDDAEQIIASGAAIPVGHFVIGMKRGHVPRHKRIDTRDKLCHAFELVSIIAEAGNDKRDDLDPEASLFEILNRVNDILHNSAEL